MNSLALTLWRPLTGQIRLAVMFWGFGLIGWWIVLFAVSMLAVWLSGRGLYIFGHALGETMLAAYTLYVSVGIWRSATAYEGSHKAAPIIAKVVVVFFVGKLLWILANGGVGHLIDGLTSSN